MTKRTAKYSRRKVFKLSAAFFIYSLALVSCKKELTNVGDGLEDGSLNVQKTDTFTLVTYSEAVDSIETDETAVNLLGSYVDPVFGKVDCGIVTQIRLSSVSPQFGTTSNLLVDSVVLSLRFTSIKYYANIQPMTFEVYRLNDDIDRTDGTYYAFTTPNITGPNLVLAGSETITPDVVSNQIVDTTSLPAHLRIHLDPSFATTMFAANDNGNMSSHETFTSFFKGLYIKVNGSSLSPSMGTILYMVLENSVSNVTMYFEDISTSAKKSFVFNMNSSCARYNSISFDRTGTDVEAVLNDQQKGLESFYVQGSSIRGVIHIPYLMNLNYDSDGNWDPKIINKAELILPIQDYTPDGFDPSATLLLAKIVDAKLSELTLDASSGVSSSSVTYDQDAKEYRFLITREITAMLNGSKEFNGFRIYSSSFFGSTIERIIFNGAETSLKNRPRLEITYTNY